MYNFKYFVLEHYMSFDNKNGKNRIDRPKGEHRDRKPMPRPEKRELDENVIFGRNAVRELLLGEGDVEKLYVQKGEREGSINQILGIVSERGIPIIEVDKTKLDRMVEGARHQGVVAIASMCKYYTVDDILDYAREKGEPPLVVILDGVEDPHNLGAIIRSAECQGVHGVIIPKRRAVGVTTTVAKSSAGALLHMRVAKVTNLAVTIDELKEKGLWIYGADMDGSVYYESELKGPAALVLGSEGFGISRLVKEKCDFILSIPLYGRVNSMNVSCAAAVVLAEFAKQRNK